MIIFLVSICGDLVSTITRPWRQLFWLALHLYISVCSILLDRISGAFSTCIEVVTAYRRVKELERQLCFLKRDCEEEKLQNSELQKKMNAFAKDRPRLLETLDRVTVEKKKAVDTVRFLKNKDLEYLNQQLAEHEEAQQRDLAEAVATAFTAGTKLHTEKKRLEQDIVNISSLEHNSLVQAKDLASKTLHDVLTNDPYLESFDEMQSSTTRRSSSRQIGWNGPEVGLFAESEQGVAIVSSMFSACLSTLVSMVAWEAKDPCTPLVIALFTVVGMSLINVVRFFSKLQTREGFTSVALLSLNWFMLGTLAHPALPYLVHVGSGVFYALCGRFLRFLGLGYFSEALKVASNEPFELY